MKPMKKLTCLMLTLASLVAVADDKKEATAVQPPPAQGATTVSPKGQGSKKAKPSPEELKTRAEEEKKASEEKK
jgi:hypothetical protein